MPHPREVAPARIRKHSRWWGNIGVGTFKGKPNFKRIGVGQWLYTADKNKPFTFVRANGERCVLDSSFAFDGGSIPCKVLAFRKMLQWFGLLRFGRIFKFLSKDYYLWAYALHDFYYVQQAKGMSPFNFEENNLILVEAIKTLQEDHDKGGDDGVAHAIYLAVSNPFQKQRWDELGALNFT